jgi:hypothetical protein
MGIDRGFDLVRGLFFGKQSVAVTHKVFPGHEILNVHPCPVLFTPLSHQLKEVRMSRHFDTKPREKRPPANPLPDLNRRPRDENVVVSTRARPPFASSPLELHMGSGATSKEA